MTDSIFYNHLAEKSLETGHISEADMACILQDPDLELLPLLNVTYQVRKKTFDNRVKIHVLNNVESGNCPENCRYCAQSKTAANHKLAYPMKSEEEILTEAKFAHESGAFRHCMVFSGRILGEKRIARICSVVRKIKEKYDMEICVSAGFINPDEAGQLKAAGVNRYNHNLNTSQAFYPQICTSHTYEDRIQTIRAVKSNGLDLCSGVIIGMGESDLDILDLVRQLKSVQPDSIPVNFFMPVEGHSIANVRQLSPVFCLKVLCLFRLAFPATELRMAGGREYHLRSLQPLCLYAADSLFAKGYLTTGGDSVAATREMIRDNGFELERIEF